MLTINSTPPNRDLHWHFCSAIELAQFAFAVKGLHRLKVENTFEASIVVYKVTEVIKGHKGGTKAAFRRPVLSTPR